MDEKQLQALFDAMQSKLELGDFATFKNQIGSDEKFRKAFYTEASNDLELGDFNVFEESFKKKVSTTPSASAAPVSGPVSAPTSPSVSQLPSESLKSLKGAETTKVAERAKALGVDPLALSAAANDFEADDDFIIKKAKEYSVNKPEYDKSKAAYTWRNLLKTTMKNNGLSDEDADFQIGYVTKLQQLDIDPNTGQPTDAGYASSLDRVSRIRDVVNKNITKEDDRREALRALNVDAYAALYQGMKDQNVVNNWARTGNGNLFIGAGLDMLRLTDPERAKSLEERISNPYATDKDKQLYNRELENIGLNAIAFEVDRNFNRVNQPDQKPSQQFVNTLAKWKEVAEKTKRSQINRYGEVAGSDIDRMLFDVTEGLEASTGEKTLYNVAVGASEWLERGLSGIWDYATKNRDERIAADMQRDHSKYLTEELLNYADVGSSMKEAEYIPKLVDLNIKKQVDDIIANTSLSRNEKYQAVYPLIKNAYANGGIEFFSNPNKGNLNLTSKNVVHLLSTSGARSLGNLIPAAMTGGGGSTALIAGLDAAAMKYDEKFREGANDPLARSLRSGLTVGALAGIMDEAAALSKAFKGGSASLVSKPTALGAAKNIGTMVGKEEVEELATEALDGDVVKNWKEVVLSTAIIAPIFSGPTAIIDNRRSSELYRQMWFEAGSSPDVTKTGLKRMFDEGAINNNQYNDAIKRVDRMSQIVANMPKVDVKGQPLSDSQKAKYADNLMKKYEAQNIPDTLPGKMAETIKQEATKADDENAAILEGEQPPAAQELSITETITPESIEVSGDATEFANQMQSAQSSLGKAGMSVSPYTQEEYNDIASKGGQFFRAAGNKVLALLKPNGEIVSLVKDAGVKAKGAAQAMISKMKDMGGLFMDNYDIYLTPLYEKAGYKVVARVPFNEQFAPEGWDAADSPLKNKPDVVFMVRSDIAPDQVQNFADYEAAQAYTQNVVDGAVNAGLVKLPTQIAKPAQVKPIADRLRTEIFGDTQQKVASAQKALEKTGVVIQMIEDPNEFDSRVTQLGGQRGMEGVFLSDTGEILINQQKLDQGIADGRVIWHEASHPVVNIVRNTNPQLFGQVVAGLRQAAANNKGVAGALAWAESQYAQDGQGTIDDEAVVETIAGIAEGMIDITKLPTGLKQSIIDLINRIARALGFDQVLDDTDIAAFKKLAGDIANALTTGQDISQIVGEENVKATQNEIEQLRKSSASIAKQTEDKTVQGAVQPSMVLMGKQKGQDVVLYSGPASIEDLRKIKPDMYISRAADLSKSALVQGKTRMFPSNASAESKLKWADSVYAKAKDTVVSNLLFLFDSIPSEIRDISKLWYDGANIIAQELAKKYNTTIEQAAGVMASQSPQKPWYDNVHLAHFIMDFYANKKDMEFTQEMYDYYALKSQPTKQNPAGYPKQIEYLPTLKQAIGKKFADLSNYDRSVMIRADFDNNYERRAPLRIPTGEIVGRVSSMSSFSGYDTIAKGVSILENGSEQNISDNLGKAFKVRNFNNNISDPRKDGEVTIDTHAMAAAYLLPLGASSPEVKFDEGTYAFFADAYRDAAKQRGVLAREMQSIVWEGVRSVFPAAEKSEANKNKAKEIWSKYKDGTVSLTDVQNQIKENGKDLSITDWSRFTDTILEENRKPSYLEELPLASRDQLAAELGDGGRDIGGVPGMGEGGVSPSGRVKMQARVGRPVVGQIDWQRSPEGKGDPSISARSKMVTQAAADLRDGKITNEEYRATVSENSPIMPITRFFEPATEAEVERSLDKNQAMKANTPVEDGTKVGLRLDIPAYKNNNTWVVSVHEGDNKAGKAISYRNVARITDVRFGVEPKASLNIAAGLGKAPINRIYGKWKNIPGTSMTEQAENAKALVQEIVDDPSYVQVGMNPFRHSYFYDRNTDIGRPIVSADEVIQVGGLVYAKNPVYGNWTDESYRVKGMLDAAGAPVQFSRGNRMESSKDFKLAAFVMREKADGAPMSEIVSGIASVFPNMSPQEIKDLVDDPETWLRNKYANLSKAMQDNLIARARVKNIYAPRTGAVAPAFQGLEVPMSKIEEATQAPTFKERVDKVFTNFKNKFIDPAKGLPDWIISLKDFAGGTKQIEISRAELTIRQLKEVAKKIGFTDWDTFAAALKSIPQPIQKPVGAGAGIVAFNPSVAAAGAPYTIPNSMLPQTTPPAVQALPLEIIPFVYKMRGQIDGLTKDLIASGYVTPEQAAKLESNIGQYVNRAYRLYNEKGWRPDQDQIREATKFLADQYIKQLATDNAGVLTYEQVEKQAIEKAKRDVNEILDKKTNPYFAAKSESRNMGILKERKDIPEPIRKLMGEYTDPGTVFIMTVAKQAALKASSEYLTKVRNMGMGTLFFEENDPNRPASASVQIAAEGSDTKSPLNGLYTMPEVAEAMETVNPTYNEVVNLWMKAVGAVRWGKTVGSVKTQLLNFESNLGFAVMNGLLMTGATGKAFNESRKYVGGQYSNKELSDITQKVIQLGLVGQGVNATELAKMLGSGDIHDIALDLAVNPDSKYRMAKKAPGKALGVLNKLYRMGDDFWKVYAYMNERELVAGAMFDKKYADLTDQEQADVDIESSERVKSTWPTYDRVFPAVKAISQNTPIFGNFISFRAESIRVLANSIAMAIKDLKTPGFEGLGARRMAGILSYIAIRSGVTYAFAQAAGMAASGLTGLMFGGDDEEERKKRAIKQAAPSFMATQDLAVLPTKDKHKFVVYSLSGIDPYNTTFNTINALTDGTATKKPGPAAAFSEFFGGFLSPEMTFNTAWSVLTNTNSKNGDRIVGDTDEGADAYAKIGAYLFDELKPSTIGMVQRLAGDNPSAELASLVGARPYEVDLHKSFSFALSDMGKQMEEVKKAYDRVKYNEKSTADEKALAQKEAEQKKALLIERMNQRFNDYVLLGADPAELRKIILERSQIKTTGFDKQTKIGIINGNVNPESLYK